MGLTEFICADFIGAVGAAALIEMGSMCAVHRENWPNSVLTSISLCFSIMANTCSHTAMHFSTDLL